MSEYDFDALEEQLEEEAESSSGSSGYEKVERAQVNVIPKVGIAFDEVTDLYLSGYITTQDGDPIVDQNVDVGIVLKNPRVVRGSLWENNIRGESYTDEETGETTQAEFAREHPDAGYDLPYHSVDYKVLNKNDTNFDVGYDKNGDVKDVTAGRADAFKASEVDEFAEDEIVVYLSSFAGMMVARQLDIHGDTTAYINDDGEHTNGLVEWGPDSVDEAFRYARYPEVRDIDWESKDGGFLYVTHHEDVVEDYEGPMHHATVRFNDFEGGNVMDATKVPRAYNPDHDDLYENAPLAWGGSPDAAEDSTANDADNDVDYGVDGSESDDSGSEKTLTPEEENFVNGFPKQAIPTDGGVADIYEDGMSRFTEIVTGQLGEDADVEFLASEIEERA